MFKPILDRVLVKRVEPAKPDSLIVEPEIYQQQSNEGVVVAIGNCVVLGGRAMPMSDFVRVGDRVRFGVYNAEEVDKEHVLVRVQDIRGVEREESYATTSSR